MVDAVVALLPLLLRTNSAPVPSGSSRKVGLKLKVKVLPAVADPGHAASVGWLEIMGCPPLSRWAVTSYFGAAVTAAEEPHIMVSSNRALPIVC